MPPPVDAATGIDKAAVASRFNRSAGTYDHHSNVQRLMAERLQGRLQSLAGPVRILELGCGTGYLTRLLADRFPGSRIMAVDFAARMVGLARRRTAAPQVEFEVADAETADFPADSFDLIVSNATVQWFDDPERTLARLAACLRPQGVMLHSTFGPQTFSELRSFLGEGASRAAGLPLRTAAEWAGILARSGLSGVQGCGHAQIVRYPGAADFLTELHATGATWRPHNSESPPLPPGMLRRALDGYDAKLSSPEGIPVTYELIEVSGVRPPLNHLKDKQK